MKKRLALIIAVLLVAAILPAQAAQVKFKNVSVHDPSVLYDDGMYYIYGSHMQAARSENLVDWKMFSKLDKCNLQPNYAVQFKEALTFAQTGTFWAPDVIRLADGRYYMYYCCCEGSSPLSALGLAVSDSPEGPFENVQILLKSGYEGYDATKLPNAIDPCVFFDKTGERLWMVYGSYSGGIFLLELDPATGLIKEGQEEYGIRLLGGNHARIEAPYIIYNRDTDYYYLFLSFGGLGVNDGYNMRVCRSRNVEGPYEDAQGHDMRDCMCKPGNFWNDDDVAGFGVKLMGGHQLWEDGAIVRSPGHNSAIETEDGWFLIHHTRFAPRDDRYIVQSRGMWFNDFGWPVVAPTRYVANLPEDEAALTGAFRVLFHGQDTNAVEHLAMDAEFHEDGTVSGSVSGSFEAGETLSLNLDGVEYHGVCCMGYDSDQDAFVTTFTAMSEDGQTVWGVRAAEQD
ncbi:MAG: glycoside hydrolase family 43 protein [Clostridia bacterium]|nr:glycoside hydrolase family 43 protein [Clostridia bacterium]